MPRRCAVDAALPFAADVEGAGGMLLLILFVDGIGLPINKSDLIIRNVRKAFVFTDVSHCGDLVLRCA